jgi:hypothetical protein
MGENIDSQDGESSDEDEDEQRRLFLTNTEVTSASVLRGDWVKHQEHLNWAANAGERTGLGPNATHTDVLACGLQSLADRVRNPHFKAPLLLQAVGDLIAWTKNKTFRSNMDDWPHERLLQEVECGYKRLKESKTHPEPTSILTLEPSLTTTLTASTAMKLRLVKGEILDNIDWQEHMNLKLQLQRTDSLADLIAVIKKFDRKRPEPTEKETRDTKKSPQPQKNKRSAPKTDDLSGAGKGAQRQQYQRGDGWDGQGKGGKGYYGDDGRDGKGGKGYHSSPSGFRGNSHDGRQDRNHDHQQSNKRFRPGSPDLTQGNNYHVGPYQGTYWDSQQSQSSNQDNSEQSI